MFYSVGQAAKFIQSPRTAYPIATKKIVRYLKGTLNQSLHFKRITYPRLYAYCDAEWGGNPGDRISVTDGCIYFGTNIVSWVAKKQTVVFRFSTEAEYRAMANTSAEIRWFLSLFRELHIPIMSPPILKCDNSLAIFLAFNPVIRSKSRHVEMKLGCFFCD